MACSSAVSNPAKALPLVKAVTNPSQRVTVGQVAPDFSWTENGVTKSLAQFKGQPVILNWWATWCEPCRDEMPLLTETAQAKANLEQGLVIIGINLKESESEVQKFSESYQVRFKLLRDENALLSLPYKVSSLPQTILIDRNGIVKEIWRAPLTASLLKEKLNQL